MLTATDHSRDKAGLQYIYPVLSRRSGGLSVGVNLNTNNACNWACIYCQVPDLIRGSAPPVDFDGLEDELRYFLSDVSQGDFYQRESVPEQLRSIRDIAIAGNGEPTLVDEFDRVVDVIGGLMGEFELNCTLVLITNGSMLNRLPVQQGLKKISDLGGEAWVKVDSALPAGIKRINRVGGSPRSTLKRLETSCAQCSTWIQTCVFAYEYRPPAEEEIGAYLSLIEAVKSRHIPIEGVLLYGMARPSMQPDSGKLSRLPEEWLKQFAARIGHYDMDVRVFP